MQEIKTRVVHCKKEPYDVYIGRPSKWGNPYSHKEDGTLAQFKVKTRAESIKKFEEYLLSNEELMSSLHELKGKTLGCWCKKENIYMSCHGDVLADLCNLMTSLGITQISTLVEIYRNKKDDLIKNRKSQSFKYSGEPLF